MAFTAPHPFTRMCVAPGLFCQRYWACQITILRQGFAGMLSFKIISVFGLVTAISASGNVAGFDLVDIPAGLARLGDRMGDDNEIVKSVEISAFELMRREVTNRQFERFIETSGYQTTAGKSGSGYVWKSRWRLIKQANWRHPQGPQSTITDMADHPVVQVSAIDAQAFCRFYGLRLPSENEWEYAARSSQGYRYPWGNSLTRASLAKRANAGTYSCCAASKTDGYLRTAPVGSFPAGRSPFGLDDMAGNVWEWTSSRFPGAPGERVIRGGGWGNNPYCLRTAYRHGNPPDTALDMVGFRCAGGR